MGAADRGSTPALSPRLLVSSSPRFLVSLVEARRTPFPTPPFLVRAAALHCAAARRSGLPLRASCSTPVRPSCSSLMPPTSCQAHCLWLPSTRLSLLATITAHQSLSRHHHHPSSPPPCHPAIHHPPAAIRHPSPTIHHHFHPSSLPSIITAVIITSIRHHGQHHHHQRHHQYRYIPTHPLKPTHRQHHHLRRSSPCAPTLTTYSNPHPRLHADTATPLRKSSWGGFVQLAHVAAAVGELLRAVPHSAHSPQPCLHSWSPSS